MKKTKIQGFSDDTGNTLVPFLQKKSSNNISLKGLPFISGSRVRSIQPKFAQEANDEANEGATLQCNSTSSNQHAMLDNNSAIPRSQNGVPAELQSGLERLSGVSLSNVRVHYNSNRPEQMDALAYTQGQDIYLGPGQEKHLPHEAWHAVQQKQGRVKPTGEINGSALNSDPFLEQEADEMGARVVQSYSKSRRTYDYQQDYPVPNQFNSQLIQRTPFRERNDPAVFQGDETTTISVLSLEQLFQLFTLTASQIQFTVTNRDGEEQTVRFTRGWVYADRGPGPAIIRGRVRYEIDQNIATREAEMRQLIEGLTGDSGRQAELNAYLNQSIHRYQANGDRTVESGVALVEEAYGSGRSFRARGYNYTAFGGPNTQDFTRPREGQEAEEAEERERRQEVNSWEEALALNDDMRAWIRHRGYTDEQIDRFHRQRLERSRQDVGLNEFNTHLIRLHAAWDVSGPSRTAVYVPISGIVSAVRSSSTYGNYVRIRHHHVEYRHRQGDSPIAGPGDVYTNYCHLSQILVRQGQRVHPGQAIGLMGNTGIGGGPHLHFSVVTRDETTSEEEVRSSINPRTWWQQVTGNSTPYVSRVVQRQPIISGTLSTVQRWGGDTSYIHRERSELYRRHARTGRRVLSESEVAHSGAVEPALVPSELAYELVLKTLRVHFERASLIPRDYFERILTDRASYSDINETFESILAAANSDRFTEPSFHYENQMMILEREAPRLLRVIENHWIHDPNVSGLDILGERAARYRDFHWHPDDYIGVPLGPNEGLARNMINDLSQIRPERRPHQRGAHQVVRASEYSTLEPYIVSHLRPIPPFNSPPQGSETVPVQPGGEQLLDIALDSFLRMRNSALADGVALVVGAPGRRYVAYRPRSVTRASSSSNPNSYATAADFSVHNLGLAVDLAMNVPGTQEFRTSRMQDVVEQRRSVVHRWMLIRGAEHGWYPFQHEPWHWEYNPPDLREQLLRAAGRI